MEYISIVGRGEICIPQSSAVKLVLRSAAPKTGGSRFFLNLNLPTVAWQDFKIEIKELKADLQGSRKLSALQTVPGGGTGAGTKGGKEHINFVNIRKKIMASECKP